MREIDRWIYFGGPAPASVRALLSAVGEGEAAGPTPEDKARVMGAFFAGFDERVAGPSDEHAAYVRRSDVYAVPPDRPAMLPGDEAPKPTVVRAPDHLRGTAEALDLPASVREAMGRLPFTAPAAAPPAPIAGAARTLQVRAMPSLGETLPLDGDAIQKAVAAVPFTAATGGAGIVALPELTVKQYLSLRAELLLRPDQTGETLRRYGVPHEAARRALDDHRREWFAASAERFAHLGLPIEPLPRARARDPTGQESVDEGDA